MYFSTKSDVRTLRFKIHLVNNYTIQSTGEEQCCKINIWFLLFTPDCDTIYKNPNECTAHNVSKGGTSNAGQ